MSTNALGNQVKTWTLLAALGGLFIVVGGLLGGRGGMTIALGLAVVMNVVAYWSSDTIALRANGARELTPGELPRLRQIVETLSQRAGIPTPRIYIVERPEPNAFATGRSPSHSAIAVTRGILDLMNERELAGVLAHELSHVRNRDTLVGTVAATFGAAISWMAQMAQWSLFFGGGRDNEGNGNALGALLAMILAPIAAVIIQLAVSRSREYQADRSGAELTGDPEGLAEALEQLEVAGRQQRGIFDRFRGRMGGRVPAPQPALNPAFAHLYITSPLRGSDLGNLFSTHPPLEQRIARLRAMRENRLARPI